MSTEESNIDWTPQIGDRVKFQWGTYPAIGTIIEDRGPLARDGKHIWGIRAKVKGINHFYIELRKDFLSPLPIVRRVPIVRRAARVRRRARVS